MDPDKLITEGDINFSEERHNFKILHGNVIQLSPSLTISRKDLNLAVSILADAFKKHC